MELMHLGSVVLTDGPNKGQTIDAVAQTDPGLVRLNDMRHDRDIPYKLRQHIAAYLNHPIIAKELAWALQPQRMAQKVYREILEEEDLHLLLGATP